MMTGLRRFTWALALLAGMAVPAWAEGLLRPMGPVAAEQQVHLLRVIGITAIAVLPVLIGVPLIAWRYARRRRGTYRPDFEFSGPLELVMWGVPAVLVAILGFWLWQSTSRLDPYKALGPDPLQVEVIGLDWKWLFIYPEQHVATLGRLVLPVGRPVRLRLTTDTVMQSFMVPALAGQIYAMPGMVTEQNLIADAAGTMVGRNTQFNGVGFAGQTVDVETLATPDWQAWVSTAANLPALDADTYAELARAGTLEDARKQLGLSDGQPILLQLADDTLFDDVLGRYHDGKPVTGALQPGAPAYQPEAKP